ncbi:LysR family transcriptional regulator [Pandoraea terrae]|uniref:LysR family transcriptional regulator n=1 Tax=Pandoraea terrae TaxID=1537710 RepID=A0A5E4Y4L5_9BURK|nr:LysR family transcriptional regulator [Pandoraea terrae]
MDLRQLRYFPAVAKHGSISIAAQAVHIAQPTLTR